MKTNLIRIIAAVVDTRNLTLYKQDGTIITIPQGDVRLRRIIELAAPDLVRQGWAEVDIGYPADTTYADFEKESGGAVKFFRIAKSKLKNLFNPEPATVVDTAPVTPLSIGLVPTVITAVTGAMHSNLDDAIAFAEANVAEFNAAMSATPALDELEAAIAEAKDQNPPPFLGVGEDSDPLTDGSIDQDDPEEEEEIIQHEPSEPAVAHTMSVVEEILQHAIPVSSADFHEEGIAKQGNVVEKDGTTVQKHEDHETKEDTIIAVVGNKILPGMERIKTQFDRASKLGSTVGVERFLQRLAAVIEKRSHSVDDLLKFMERGDLPIADDGSILIYKVLNSRSEGKYVDCHTKNVEQWVGAYVCMDPSLVDHNRKNECSNGLHVARRGYIHGFSGDVCVLAKLDPEDVIAVPEYDANKMRVCGYHIIHVLSSDQYAEVNKNRPITNTAEGQRLLADMLAGNHIRRTHEVRITQQRGGGVVVTQIDKPKGVAPAPTMADVPASLISAAADAVEEFDEDELERHAEELRSKEAAKAEKVMPVKALENPNDGKEGDAPTNPMDVIKTVEQLSRKEQAAKLYDAFMANEEGARDALFAFKKASKVGWDRLGIPDPTAKQAAKPSKKKVKAAVKAALAPKPNTTPKVFDEPKPAKVAKVKTKGLPQVHDVDFGDEPPDRPDNTAPAEYEGSPRERIQKMLAIGLNSGGVAQAILTIKQKSKKSWTVLGVSDDQVAQIIKLAGA